MPESVYRQRNPQNSHYYQCVEDYFETFEQVYEDRFDFLYDRKLLSELSRCGWESLKAFYTTGVRNQKAVPGAVVAIQTFGDFPQGFHPHLHILISDGCFHENGMFSVSPAVDTKALEQLFRRKVLKMLFHFTRDSVRTRRFL